METVKELPNFVKNYVNQNINQTNSLILLHAYNNYRKKNTEGSGNI